MAKTKNCSGCRARGKDRLPPGWKSTPQGVLCKDCVKARYVTRSVELPAVGPVGMTWDELRPTLDAAWAESTALANWACSELYARDVKRTPGMARLPPMPKLYLYGHAKSHYARWGQWVGASQAVIALLKAVEGQYRKWRFDVLWRGVRSLASFRHPYPYPVDADGWAPSWGENKAPLVSVALPGGRVTLRLRRGAEFGRQLAGFRQLENGEALKGELALRKNRRTGDLMVKLVGRFPRRECEAGTHTLLVRTDPGAFWVAEQEGYPPWIVNADHVRRWVTSHRVFLQRVGEDTKYEKRVPRPQRRHIDAAVEARCIKQWDRLDDFTHTISAQLAGLVSRRKVGTVIYDDSCQDYLERFPWEEVRTKLAYKLDALKVELVARASGEAVDETPAIARKT